MEASGQGGLGWVRGWSQQQQGMECMWEGTEGKTVQVWSLNQSWRQGHLREEIRSLTGCLTEGCGPRNLYF